MKGKIISVVVLLSFFGLITASLFIVTTDTRANTNGATLTIKIHQIRELDEIEGHIGQNGADWYYKIYVFDGDFFGNMYETDIIEAPQGEDNPILNNIHSFTVYGKNVLFFIKLMENDGLLFDLDYGNDDDLADISGQPGGGAHDTTIQLEGALYMGYYNLLNNSLWGDKTLTISSQGEIYFYTSGHSEPDSSIDTDENDAAILFQITDNYGEPTDDIDMLIVTNKKNLFDHHGSNAQDIITKIEDVAAQQNGIILDTTYDKTYDIKREIKEKAKQYEELKYLMIVGGDEIIPFFEWPNPNFGYKFPDGSTDDDTYIYTDYFYGDLNDDLIKVDLAIGRIIGDGYDDLISLLDVSLIPNTDNDALIARDDHHIDDAKIVEKILSDNGLFVENYANDIGLVNHLQDKSLIYHMGHANWYTWGNKLFAATLHTPWTGLGDTHPVVHTTGCYAALAKSGDLDYMGLWGSVSIPMAFIGEGASTYIGATGSSIVDNNGEGFSETLNRYFIEGILDGESTGNALKEALKSYINEHSLLFENNWSGSGLDRKTVLQFVHYGNPKYIPYPGASYQVTSAVDTTLFDPGVSIFCADAGADIHTLNVNISISNYTLVDTGGYDIISIPGAGFGCDSNGYTVPSLSSANINLTKNSEPQNINLTSFKKIKLPGTYNFPFWSPTVIGHNGSTTSAIDNSSKPLYTPLFVENPNGTKTVVIQILPVEYNPDTCEAYLYTDFNFSIDYLISNVQLSDLYISKQYISKGEEISVSTNLVNTGLFLSNLTLETTVGINELEAFANQWNENSSVYELAAFAANYGLVTSTFDEGGDHLVKTALRDASGHTLDVKYGMFHVMQEPNITIFDTFVTQNSNITNKINPSTPFTFVTLVDNNGDYNATGVYGELTLPSGVEIQDSTLKILNDGTLPGFDTGYLEWVLLASTPGNYTVSVDVFSTNGGTDSRIYNITVSQSTVSQSEFTVDPAYQEVRINNDFTINLTIHPGEPIAGSQFDLFFDENLITVNSVTEGEIFNGYDTFFSPGTIDNINGKIIGVYGVITTPGASASTPGTLACIHFTAKGDEGTSFLNLSNVVVGDPNASPIPVVIHNGTVIITIDDTEPPVSHVNPITPYKYHLREIPLDITVNAFDYDSGVQEVFFYYRYSDDNTTWTDWMLYGENKIASPYTWQFTSPNGTGYYEFYSQAVDNVDNLEPMPFVADAICRIYPNWDVNMDQNINVLDIITIGQHWGETGPPCWIPQDVNRDGVVNILDIIIIAQHWTG